MLNTQNTFYKCLRVLLVLWKRFVRVPAVPTQYNQDGVEEDNGAGNTDRYPPVFCGCEAAGRTIMLVSKWLQAPIQCEDLIL